MPILFKQKFDNFDVIYDNCKPDDELWGEKISSIVGYVFNAFEISQESSDPTKAFQIYCDAFSKKIKSSDLYHKEKFIKTTEVTAVARELMNLLPEEGSKAQDSTQFTKMIEGIKDSAKRVDSLGQIENPLHLILRAEGRSEKSNFFTTLKIFRTADSLELIPCYISISSRKEVAGFLVFRHQEESTSICYKQRKFYITKYDMQHIIERIKRDAEKRWLE